MHVCIIITLHTCKVSTNNIRPTEPLFPQSTFLCALRNPYRPTESNVKQGEGQKYPLRLQAYSYCEKGPEVSWFAQKHLCKPADFRQSLQFTCGIKYSMHRTTAQLWFLIEEGVWGWDRMAWQ